MSTAVNTIASSKIWEPITIIGSIIAAAALILAGKEILAAKKTMAKKQEVKQGLAAVKAELTEVVASEDTSNCAGCMSSASGTPYRANDVQIINPSSLIPEVYS